MCSRSASTRIDNNERPQAPPVDAIEVGVVVRDDPVNVWRDGGAQLPKVTFGDDGAGDVEQRSPGHRGRAEHAGELAAVTASPHNS